MLRTETDVKYIGDEAVIVPLDVPVSSTYEHLLSMIYSRTGIDKKQFQLVLNCRYPLKRENRFQPCPIWDDNSLSQMLKLVNTFGMDEIELYIEQVPVQPRVRGQLLGNFTQLLLGQNDNVEEFEYGCGPSSAPVAMTYECRADEMKMKKNVNPKKVMIKVREQKIFNMMAMGYLQHAAKLYSISAHQEYVVVESTTKLLVLRCKKAKQSQCPWKLRAMVVKELPHFFIALEQANPGCVVISKTFPGIMENTEIFQRVFWTFHPSIEGFKHCRPVLSIDVIPLAFALIEDRHPGIMAAMSDVHLGWSEPYAYHRVCMRHLASNFMTRFKDKILKNLMCRAALATKIEKFNKHMNTIGRINAAAQQWLEAIPFEKWALSHDGGRRYGIMTTNMSEEQGANRLASNEEYTPYVDAKIKANVVKAGSHEIVLYDHIRGQFHVKTNKGTKSSSTRGRTYRINLQEYACTCGKTLIYGFPCSHILAACHFRSVDFRPLVQHYYSTQSYYNSWAPLFHPIFNVYEWPPYDGPIIVPSESMKRASSGRPKSSRLHNEMDVREGKTSITYMEYRGHSSDPDPLDTSVLVLQDRHRSHLVDSGQS
ncbi:hypothetical protein CK203_094864 [Vitis vinifera]|uniref:SWIM-type domain-containing protein n=1 Tax=Vitis vinifera TaxID=29760 RepID=A0A438D043_VITVI|nr:hypothetical protein CK203_094864 [Vitis vinifera]